MRFIWEDGRLYRRVRPSRSVRVRWWELWWWVLYILTIDPFSDA